MLHLLGLVILAYVAVALFLFAMQERLLFLPGIPGRALETTPAAHGMAFDDVFLDTDDGERIHGWWVPARGATEETPAGTVVIFHGNAGNISHRIETLRVWHGLDWNALIIDYRGYGQSTGRPTEEGTYHDARAVWRHLTEDRGIAADEIVLFGRSLGAAVATRLATEVDPLALILESTLTSVPDLAAELYWWLPVRLLARISYPTAKLLGDVRAPVLVVHSPDDEIIPFHHGLALYEAAGRPKEFLELTGGHNEGFLLMGHSYQAALEGFLIRALSGRVGSEHPGSR